MKIYQGKFVTGNDARDFHPTVSVVRRPSVPCILVPQASSYVCLNKANGLVSSPFVLIGQECMLPSYGLAGGSSMSSFPAMNSPSLSSVYSTSQSLCFVFLLAPLPDLNSTASDILSFDGSQLAVVPFLPSSNLSSWLQAIFSTRPSFLPSAILACDLFIRHKLLVAVTLFSTSMTRLRNDLQRPGRFILFGPEFPERLPPRQMTCLPPALRGLFGVCLVCKLGNERKVHIAPGPYVFVF